MKSFICWVGGKSRIAKTIAELLPPHDCYAEVFGGAGWVMFAKEPSKVDVINDRNRDLITAYRVIKHHPREFLAQLKGIPAAREEFDRLLNTDVNHLTDIQRAARFYYLNRVCFGGRVTNPSFVATRTRASRYNPASYKRDIVAVTQRLQRVTIENLDYSVFINRYDSPRTVFYLDPPYYDCEDYYGKHLFAKGDFAKLAGLLAGIKGKFILSINDHPAIRETFNMFNFRDVETTYTIAGAHNRKVVGELLITNY